MLTVTPQLFIDEDELVETFVRASGPGGQNVNKVATAVQLRFDVKRSPSLPEAVRERLLRLAAGRLTGDGVLLIEARQFRTQEQNRREARRRLVALLRQAAREPKTRRATAVPAAAQQKRLEAKRRRSRLKRLRRAATELDD
ncbi:MAG: aminoacyl-tRNA hydrolase [Anaerolineales bacterium]|nr:aminoacyl-tRNA hydrolase [Anaerolineales bacterium]MDW8328074.1 alternative ribosome rescue aminoacyl-tRNA hydrolase ArfB [Anaerolineales bacterium]